MTMLATPMDRGTVALMATPRTLRHFAPSDVDAVRRFRADPDPSGVLLLRGLDLGDPPPTPASPTAAIATVKDDRSERALLALGGLLGEPVGFVQEHGGVLVQDIVPTETSAGRQISTGSRVALDFHTETAFHRHRPRYLLLGCLRPDPERRAETLYLSVADLLAHLDPADVAILRQARFRIGVDESFAADGRRRLGQPLPVLSGSPDRPVLVFDADLMVATDPGAGAVLDRVRAVVAAQRHGVRLDAGDVLVIDNHLAVHGRAPFQAHFDGTDRWLQRVLVVEDLATVTERSGRIITTAY